MPAFTTAALAGIGVTAFGTAATAATATAAATAGTISGLGLLAADAAILGGGAAAYGAYSQGQEARQMSNQQASVLAQQAALERASGQREADIIGQNAALNEYRARKSMNIITGEQIGGYAARGVSVGTGSPLDVIADSITNAELDIAIDKWSAKTQSDTALYNAETAAKNKESDARFRRLYGQSAATNSLYQGVGTLLSSGTQAAYRLGNENYSSSRGYKSTIG